MTAEVSTRLRCDHPRCRSTWPIQGLYAAGHAATRQRAWHADGWRYDSLRGDLCPNHTNNQGDPT